MAFGLRALGFGLPYLGFNILICTYLVTVTYVENPLVWEGSTRARVQVRTAPSSNPSLRIPDFSAALPLLHVNDHAKYDKEQAHLIIRMEKMR